MRRPVWFRRHGLRWTPCAWQGWLVMGVFILLMALGAFWWASPAPALFVAVSMALVGLLLSVAVLTDDTHGSTPSKG